MKKLLTILAVAFCANAQAATNNDVLIQVTPEVAKSFIKIQSFFPKGSKTQDLKFNNWYRVEVPKNSTMNLVALRKQAGVVHAQPNYKIRMLENPSFYKKDVQARMRKLADDCPIPIPGFCDGDGGGGGGTPTPPGGGDDDCPIPIPGFCDGDGGGGGGTPTPPGGGGGGGGGGTAGDNPAIPSSGTGGSGDDPLLNKQWGMIDIGVTEAWRKHKGASDMVVAVIDTGVDYTHEDLVDNLWRNPGETGQDAQGKDKATNGVDDDGNGFIDDQVGWDFVSNDNKPYDLKGNLFNGGNPGHGTHCAGNVAARGFNGKGVSGVAPNVKIMILRFLSDKGGGTTADAIKSIKYAVDNGAMITSNSWGSEGEDPNDAAGNKALRDAVDYAEGKGTLFIAAAGNGHQGRGYDNDNDSKPGYPASYPHESIISVAAVDSSDKLGSFSNWGRISVDIAAPGVKVFSTVVGGDYTDTVLPILGATWDGTSMATPHVAGAAALYWSAHPDKTWQEVKAAILGSAKPISAVRGKVTSDGKLDVKALMNF